MVARNNLSVSLMAIGRAEEAIEVLSAAIPIAKAHGDDHFLAVVELNLGGSYSQLGDIAKALAHYERGMALAKKSDNRRAVAKALSGMASAYYHAGDYGPAKKMYAECLERAEAMQSPALIAECLHNLGNAEKHGGTREQATAYYKRALAIRKQLGDVRMALRLREALATNVAAEGRHEEAIVLFEKILEEQLAIRDTLGAALTRVNLSASVSKRGDHKKAVGIGRSALLQAKAISDRYAMLHAYVALTRATLGAGQWDETIRITREGAKVLATYATGQAEDQAAASRERFEEIMGIGALAAWLKNDKETTLELMETGRAGALVEVLGGRDRLLAAVVPPELARREAEARRLEGEAWEALGFAKRRLRSGGGLRAVGQASKALKEAQAELQLAVEAIERDAKSAAGLVFPRPATIEEVQDGLRPDEAFILYGMTEGPTNAMIVTRTMSA